jgi:succinate dehydrogenase / fumarate reductase membrane anchor subunit
VSKMKESKIMLIQYLTAAAALVLVTFHLLLQGVLVPYSTALSFNRVLSVYRGIIDGSLLEILLGVVVVHGFNGLRIMLLEWRQGRTWSRFTNYGTLIAILAVMGYGTRTIVLAVTGVVGA